eukprot:scaffold261262_cov15-Tisochrysis_lutea.AAC.1
MMKIHRLKIQITGQTWDAHQASCSLGKPASQVVHDMARPIQKIFCAPARHGDTVGSSKIALWLYQMANRAL